MMELNEEAMLHSTNDCHQCEDERGSEQNWQRLSAKTPVDSPHLTPRLSNAALLPDSGQVHTLKNGSPENQDTLNNNLDRPGTRKNLDQNQNGDYVAEQITVDPVMVSASHLHPSGTSATATYDTNSTEYSHSTPVSGDSCCHATISCPLDTFCFNKTDDPQQECSRAVVRLVYDNTTTASHTDKNVICQDDAELRSPKGHPSVRDTCLNTEMSEDSCVFRTHDETTIGQVITENQKQKDDCVKHLVRGSLQKRPAESSGMSEPERKRIRDSGYSSNSQGTTQASMGKETLAELFSSSQYILNSELSPVNNLQKNPNVQQNVSEDGMHVKSTVHTGILAVSSSASVCHGREVQGASSLSTGLSVPFGYSENSAAYCWLPPNRCISNIKQDALQRTPVLQDNMDRVSQHGADHVTSTSTENSGEALQIGRQLIVCEPLVFQNATVVSVPLSTCQSSYRFKAVHSQQQGHYACHTEVKSNLASQQKPCPAHSFPQFAETKSYSNVLSQRTCTAADGNIPLCYDSRSYNCTSSASQCVYVTTTPMYRTELMAPGSMLPPPETLAYPRMSKQPPQVPLQSLLLTARHNTGTDTCQMPNVTHTNSALKDANLESPLDPGVRFSESPLGSSNSVSVVYMGKCSGRKGQLAVMMSSRGPPLWAILDQNAGGTWSNAHHADMPHVTGASAKPGMTEMTPGCLIGKPLVDGMLYTSDCASSQQPITEHWLQTRPYHSDIINAVLDDIHATKACFAKQLAADDCGLGSELGYHEQANLLHHLPSTASCWSSGVQHLNQSTASEAANPELTLTAKQLNRCHTSSTDVDLEHSPAVMPKPIFISIPVRQANTMSPLSHLSNSGSHSEHLQASLVSRAESDQSTCQSMPSVDQTMPDSHHLTDPALITDRKLPAKASNVPQYPVGSTGKTTSSSYINNNNNLQSPTIRRSNTSSQASSLLPVITPVHLDTVTSDLQFNYSPITFRQADVRCSTLVLQTASTHTSTVSSTTSGYQTDVACPKSRFFSLLGLDVGSYRLSEEDSKKRLSRVQFQFTVGKMTYELPITVQKFGLDSSPDNGWHVCLVDVYFSSIIGLQANRTELILKVKSPPVIRSKGLPHSLAGNHLIDPTGGQLALCPYQKLILRPDVPRKIVDLLCVADRRFTLLTKQQILLDKNSAITGAALQPSVSTALEDKRPEKTSNKTNICSCTVGCLFSRCKCAASEQPCNDKCKCTRLLNNCQNPINQIIKCHIPIDTAKSDKCLMAKIFQVKNLDEYLEQQVTFPCCGCVRMLSDVIPGVVSCPTPSCTHTYKYSWCLEKLMENTHNRKKQFTSCSKCVQPNVTNDTPCDSCFVASEAASSDLCSNHRVLDESQLTGERMIDGRTSDGDRPAGCEEPLTEDRGTASYDSETESDTEVSAGESRPGPNVEAVDIGTGTAELRSASRQVGYLGLDASISEASPTTSPSSQSSGSSRGRCDCPQRRDAADWSQLRRPYTAASCSISQDTPSDQCQSLAGKKSGQQQMAVTPDKQVSEDRLSGNKQDIFQLEKSFNTSLTFFSTFSSPFCCSPLVNSTSGTVLPPGSSDVGAGTSEIHSLTYMEDVGSSSQSDVFSTAAADSHQIKKACLQSGLYESTASTPRPRPSSGVSRNSEEKRSVLVEDIGVSWTPSSADSSLVLGEPLKASSPFTTD